MGVFGVKKISVLYASQQERSRTHGTTSGNETSATGRETTACLRTKSKLTISGFQNYLWQELQRLNIAPLDCQDVSGIR